MKKVMAIIGGLILGAIIGVVIGIQSFTIFGRGICPDTPVPNACGLLVLLGLIVGTFAGGLIVAFAYKLEKTD